MKVRFSNCTLTAATLVIAISAGAAQQGNQTSNALVGRDDQVRAPSGNASGPQLVVAPVCAGVPTTTSSFSGTTGPIPTTSSATFTTTVSGVGNFLWDVNLNTSITHTSCQDLDIRLISPAGTIATITTDNGSAFDNCFNGTLWDDNVNDPATDHVYTNLVTATPMSPEGHLSKFRGENPNGTWTLRIEDDSQINTGSLSAWSLGVSALNFTPVETTTTISRTPNAAIPDNAAMSDVMPVGGLGTYLDKLTLYVEIPHTFPDDLDIRLISPSGTSVAVVTDNAGGFDNVFNGTSFDPTAAELVTDHIYANLVVVPLLSPEGSFDNFLGQNPNGNWTLSITDDTATNTGTLVKWDLRITTTPNPGAPAPTSFNGTAGAIPDSGSAAPVVFTANVSGMASYLWDVDLSTTIAHNYCADLDITLTAPSGKTVSITSDNGFTAGVFNGTLWDDDANDCVGDHFYTSGVVATPLTPEGRLSAFRGENPNGIWKLTIADDLLPVAGSLNAWSLSLTTIPFAPSTSSTTLSSSPNAPLLDNTTVTDTINVGGLGTSLYKVMLYTQIMHTWSNDLDVTLTSPQGTIVTVTTDNGDDKDDVFNGTIWDPSVTDAVSEHVYTTMVVATPLSPEGAFDNFLGENPNGLWTLSVTDDFSPDTGTFVRWDITLTTCAPSVPVAYCPVSAPGSSNGCLPTIFAASNPNVAHSNSCVITVSGVEGQKSGIIFYGIHGPINQPWCTGGNSRLCVKAPTQRTMAQNSGGTTAQCNGSLVLNWNAYQLTHPGAVGNPWLAGQKAHVQGWFRDPPSCKTTFLSQALEMTYQP